jgi:hypothetical protein
VGGNAGKEKGKKDYVSIALRGTYRGIVVQSLMFSLLKLI